MCPTVMLLPPVGISKTIKIQLKWFVKFVKMKFIMKVRIKKKVSYLISVDVLLRVIEPRAAQLLILRLLIH